MDFDFFQPRRQALQNGAGFGVEAFARVDQNQGHIGFLHGFVAALDADFFHHIIGVAQAGGVDNVHGHAVERDLFAHGVAGGAGNVGNDGDVVAGQRVEQAGFAHIGRAHQHHIHPFAQNRALLGAGEHSVQLRLQGFELAFGIGRFEKIDVFFGKIERGFHQHAQGNQLINQGVNVLGKRAFERAQRHAGGRLARGINQIGHALGLRQIELVVEKSAFGEFAGLGRARTQFEAARQQHLHHHRAAVALQLDDVFAGEARGRGEIKQQAVVNRQAVGIGKIGVERGARHGRFAAGEGLRQGQQMCAGQTNHADTAAPGGGGNGGNGGGGGRHGAFPCKQCGII